MDFFQSLRSNRSTHHAAGPGHMTWAETSMGRTVTRTGLFLKKQLWIWPIIAVIFLSILGFIVRRSIESTMKESLKSQLETLLTTESAMLEKWLEVQASRARSAANGEQFRKAFTDLLAEYQLQRDVSQEGDIDTDVELAVPGRGLGKLRLELSRTLAPHLASDRFVGYFAVDRAHQIVAASHPELIGQKNISQYRKFIQRTLDGNSVVSPPFSSIIMMQDSNGHIATGQPTMYACAPIFDQETFMVIGALALQLRPQDEFTGILQLGRMGASGETYAFDDQGFMVSNSRFDEDLILLGILPDKPDTRSLLNVYLCDPQGNMMTGYRPTSRRSQLPLTYMVQSALARQNKSNVEGYRDYRGVPVVGAWKWLEDYDIGVATEIDSAEAFRPLVILRTAFWSMYGLLIASAVAIFIFTVLVARAQREARRSAIEAQQLGQYRLEEQLGAGAMGTVYRGRHAMLQRPTAVKLLDADKINDASLKRFEREVQITCQLTHPNTIAIYDFGRTPEGVFYYAMEYLDGINLQSLVEKYGPQPSGRVIKILLQICGSLNEAHSQGLVHRDIKPANIMLNRRGAEPDVIKVLDFGLVKAADEGAKAGATAAGGLTGTPLYMSPEAIQSPMTVDGRSDLYGVGAVGYYLLTGRPVFTAESVIGICQKHLEEIPASPSALLSKPLSEQLEHTILGCLEKLRSNRPQTARDLAEKLRGCPEAESYTIDQAEAWWSRHARMARNKSDGNSVAATTTPAFEQTMDYSIG